MISIYTAVNKVDYSVHYFDSADAVNLARLMDSSAWKPAGGFKLKEGSQVSGLYVKTKQWVENRYAIK